MLLQIGQRSRPVEVVHLLYECHGRIRRFLDLAHLLASSPGVSDDEVRAAATDISRYFAVAFPLHIADENDSIAPRLAGRTPSLDTALARMTNDHEDHAVVARLIAICDAIARDPRQLAARAASLADTVDQLTLALEAHLSLEELVIFPAVEDLPRTEQLAIRDEIRLRRNVAMQPR